MSSIFNNECDQPSPPAVSTNIYSDDSFGGERIVGDREARSVYSCKQDASLIASPSDATVLSPYAKAGSSSHESLGNFDSTRPEETQRQVLSPYLSEYRL